MTGAGESGDHRLVLSLRERIKGGGRKVRTPTLSRRRAEGKPFDRSTGASGVKGNAPGNARGLRGEATKARFAEQLRKVPQKTNRR